MAEENSLGLRMSLREVAQEAGFLLVSSTFSDVANWLKNLDETIELSKKHTKK